MGVQVSFGFRNFRLILRAPEGHTTGGGSDGGQFTEAVVKDSQGLILGRRVFHDALELVAQLCPGAVPPTRTVAVLTAHKASGVSEDEEMGGHHEAVVQTGAGGHPVLTADNLNLRAAEVALVRHAVQHAETLAAAAAMLGLSTRQLQSKARRHGVALPFARRGGCRS